MAFKERVSILVFVELVLDVNLSDLLALQGCGVSILVFVELVLDGNSVQNVANKSTVSILVFVELVLDVLSRSKTFRDAEFQSLFSWNLFLMHGYIGIRDFRGDVSILVFVELVLDGSFNFVSSYPFW